MVQWLRLLASNAAVGWGRVQPQDMAKRKNSVKKQYYCSVLVNDSVIPIGNIHT